MIKTIGRPMVRCRFARGSNHRVLSLPSARRAAVESDQTAPAVQAIQL